MIGAAEDGLACLPHSGQLEKECRELRMKADFSGEAAAFFAQESR